ncbi:MAG: 7-carboxy-7-deazaguanine synthase QueE [Candidatus Helarchaeota archaeon]
MVKGYLYEVFSSIQGEGGSVPGSCFGRRQIFLRFAGCNLKGCTWCDTKKAQMPRPDHFQVYHDILEEKIEKKNNPTSATTVKQIVEQIKSPDLHSITFTGGEPLMQATFLKEVCENLKNFVLYLETNGSLPEQARQIVDYFDYCCCDIKDETAKATEDWRDLVNKEIETIKIFKKQEKKVFAKVVFTPETEIKNIKWYATELSRLSVPLVLQPVNQKSKNTTTFRKERNKKMFELLEEVGKIYKGQKYGISFQAHKTWDIL